MNIKQYVITRITSEEGSTISKVSSINTVDDFEVITFDWDNFKEFESFYRELDQKSGVYILKGRVKKEGKLTFYVGETNNLVKRLGEHKRSKAKLWVEKACLFYKGSENQFLLKNELEYLERSFISFLSDNKNYDLANRNSGKENSPLWKERKLILNASINSIIHKLDILDWNELLSSRKVSSKKKSKKGKTFVSQSELENKYFQVYHTRNLTHVDGEFNPFTNETVIFKGSKGQGISISKTEALRDAMRLFISDLLETGKVDLEYNDDQTKYSFEFLEDYSFSSPSTAGYICVGRMSCNGWTHWKLKESNKDIDVLRTSQKNNEKIS